MILYKFRAVTPHALDILQKERLYCASYKKLNDPFEGMFWVDGLRIHPDSERPERRCRTHDVNSYLLENDIHPLICSLSSNPWDVMMWGLYGDSLKGIAIEIDFSNAQADLPRKVNYLDQPYTFYEDASHFHNGEIIDPTPPNCEDILLNKSHRWQHEAEYRIIANREYISIEGLITRVIVGPRITASDYNLVESACPSSAKLVEAEWDFGWQAVISELHPDYLCYHDHPCPDYEDAEDEDDE